MKSFLILCYHECLRGAIAKAFEWLFRASSCSAGRTMVLCPKGRCTLDTTSFCSHPHACLSSGHRPPSLDRHLDPCAPCLVVCAESAKWPDMGASEGALVFRPMILGMDSASSTRDLHRPPSYWPALLLLLKWARHLLKQAMQTFLLSVPTTELELGPVVPNPSRPTPSPWLLSVAPL